MKEENKRLVAKEIVCNIKVIGVGILIGLLVTGIYAVIIHPSLTHYTAPDKFHFAGAVINEEWPETEEGDAVFVPKGVWNLGTHFGAYFSNKTKYDNSAFMRCVSTYHSYPYPSNPKISDVIQAINDTRLELYKYDVLSFLKSSMLYMILFFIVGRYIFFIIKWIIKYSK